MKISRAIAPMILLAAFATTSRAADLPNYKNAALAPPSTATTWTGAHIGAHFGYGWGRSTTGNAVLAAVYGSVPYLTGPLAGLQAGYDYEFANNFVVGAELDVSHAWLNSRVGIPPFSFASGSMDWFWSARLRLGYAIDRFLVYGTGGFTQVKTSGHGSNLFFPAGFTTGNTHNGWVIGLGAQYMITPHWLAGLEYLHGQYDKQIYVAAPRDGIADIVRLRFDYKF